MNWNTRSAILFLLMTTFMTVVKSQSIDCNFDYEYQNAKESNPAFQDLTESYEDAYCDYIKSGVKKSTTGTEFLNLPLVVHIVHQGDSLGSRSNPRDKIILDAIDFTNDIFRQTNTEEKYENPNYGADTEISFCLASRDEQGSPALGILRMVAPPIFSYNNPLFGIPSFVSDQFWDREKYINVVLFDLNGFCGVYFPNDDGVLFSNKCIEESTSLAHELGHYLSLQHTFYRDEECENEDCFSMGDFVCDTPPQYNGDVLSLDGHEDNPCYFPGNSCQSDEEDSSKNNPYRSIAFGGLGDQPDANTNIMGYGGFCRSNFTKGQGLRMKFNLTEVRENLWSDSTHCVQEVTFLNDASVDKIDVEAADNCGQSVNVNFDLKNVGSLDLKDVDILLFKNYILVDSIHWSGLLRMDQKESLSFKNVRTGLGRDLFQVQSKSPNFLTDDNPNSDNNYFKFNTLKSPAILIGDNARIACEEDSVAIGVDLSSYNSNFNFIWRRKNDLISKENRFDSILHASIPDVYSLNIYNEDYNCEWIEQFEVKLDNSQLDIVSIKESYPYFTCLNDYVILKVEDAEAFAVEWYSRDGLIQNSSNPNLVVDSAGDYRFRVIDYESSCDFFGDWVTVSDLISEELFVSVEVNDEITCENNGVLIDASKSDFCPGNYMYKWIDLNANKIINKNDTTQFFTITKPGLYKLEVEDIMTKCSGEVEFEVKGHAELPVINIVNPIIDADGLARLDASTSSQGEFYSFSWTTNGGYIVKDENTLDVLVVGSGEYKLEITNLKTGCVNFEEVDFNLRHSVDIFDAQCLEGTPVIAVRVHFNHPYDYEYFSPEIIITYPDGSHISFTSISALFLKSAGTYELKYRSGQDTIRDSFVIYPEMLETPVANILVDGPIYCQDELVLLSGENSEFNTNDIFIWRDVNSFIIGQGNDIEVQAKGEYSLEIVNPLTLCGDKIKRELLPSTDFDSASAGVDKILICGINDVELGLNEPNENHSFDWSLINESDTTFLTNTPKVIVNTEGLYSLVMYNSLNDCTSFDEVVVSKIVKDVDVKIKMETKKDTCDFQNALLTVDDLEGVYDYSMKWLKPDGSEEEKYILFIDEFGEYVLTLEDKNTSCIYTDTFVYSPMIITEIFNLEDKLRVLVEGGTPPYSYIWNTGGTSELIQDPVFKDYYQVTVTDANGCTVTQEIQYLQPPNNESVLLLPNPASSYFQIFTQTDTPIEELKIYNTIGTCVKTIQDYQSLDWIDVSRLSSGVYIAVLSSKSLNYTSKFVKK